jgi:hypothetical protein
VLDWVKLKEDFPVIKKYAYLALLQEVPRLLEEPNLPPEDKQAIKELLNKPWNPYIRRHSALTEKSGSKK